MPSLNGASFSAELEVVGLIHDACSGDEVACGELLDLVYASNSATGSEGDAKEVEQTLGIKVG